ncbi:hypothetical protein AHF37_08173 [Paragonimus kellicotti]|nr:hypothetical protein AHF37_08173 [Paragonimus kellicotti]
MSRIYISSVSAPHKLFSLIHLQRNRRPTRKEIYSTRSVTNVVAPLVFGWCPVLDVDLFITVPRPAN